MKAWIVYATFDDDGIEGVVFTDKTSAIEALNGTDNGSTLAINFHEMYSDEREFQMKEITIS